jgi:signal transduction histidine kinase
MSESIAEAHLRLIGRPVAITGRTFSRLVILAVILGFGAVLIASASAVWSVIQDQTLTRLVYHTVEVRSEIDRLRVMLEQGEAARRGYMISADPITRQSFEQVARDAPREVERLAALTRDNPAQQQRLAALREALKGHLASSRWSIETVAKGEQAAAMRMFRSDQAARRMADLRGHLDGITAEEQRLLDLRRARQQASARNLQVALAVAGPLLILVAIGSTALIFAYTRDLTRSGAALRALNESLESAVAARTARLARANEEIQRFAYIVSHDLRSPLVNIMGFTAELDASLKSLDGLVRKLESEAPDLLAKDAQTAVHEEIPEALGFIRKSTQRMDRLINAILQLSRSGRRPLKPEPISMTRLISDLAANLKQRAEEAGAEIIVSPSLPDLVGDRLALEQVFQNLMENAVKYLAPGRPGRIEIVGRPVPGRQVEIAVADNGRGIDPRDHERIFELFRRSGRQDRPGEGIGLAAVRATIQRLGGSISVDSTLDQGAVFRVLLPAVLRIEPEPTA